MSTSNNIERFVPVFDGANFLEWKAQMTAYLQERGLWRIVNGAITLPVLAAGITQAQIDAWIDKDEQAQGILTLRIAHNLRTGVLANSAAGIWTNLNNTFARTGVAAVYQDFKAALRVKVGTYNPAKDITKLQTHLIWKKSAGNIDQCSLYSIDSSIASPLIYCDHSFGGLL